MPSAMDRSRSRPPPAGQPDATTGPPPEPFSQPAPTWPTVRRCPRAFLPALLERGAGDVINLASVSGKRPLTRRTPYTASKMTVIGLTTTLAGVSVNCLSAGPVNGPRMTRNFKLEAERTGTTYEGAEQAYVSRAALHRMLTEDEVAAAVVAMLHMPGLCAADIDLSAGMVAR